MEPEASELFAGERLRLRNFILVVGENEVLATGMQVERLAQFLHGHDGALNMPAGPAWPNLTFPECFAGLRSLPQREVAGVVFLVFIHVDASAIFHSGKIF